MVMPVTILETYMKQNLDEPEHRDPVCGMRVCRSTAAAEFDFGGKTYYFCAGACRDAFAAEPSKYVRVHRQHGMKSRPEKR